MTKENIKLERAHSGGEDVPEGGWGWIVTIGMAFMFVVTVGPMASFGLIFGQYLTDLGEGTKSVTVITSILFSAFSLTGLVTNYSLKSYTCRQVGVFGGILYFIGNLLTIFASSVSYLIISFAIIPGIGMGLMAPASFSCFNTYFLKKRKLAMGIAQIIMGAGAAVFPLLVQVMVHKYGFRGAQAILSGLSLHAILAMGVLKPAIKRNVAIKIGARDVNTTTGIPKRSGVPGQRKSRDVTEDVVTNNKMKSGRNEFLSSNNKSVYHQLSDDSKEDCTIAGDQELLVVRELNVTDVQETSLKDDSEEEKEDVQPLLVPQSLEKGDVRSDLDVQSHPVHVAALFPLQRITLEPRPSITSVRSWMLPGPIEYIRNSIEDNLNKQTKTKNKAQAIVDLLDLTLLQDPVYVSMVLGVSCVYFADMMFFLLLPIIVTSMEFSTSEAAVCLSVGFAGDLVGRLFLVGMALVWPSLTSRRFFFVGALFSVVFRTVFTELSSYYAILILSGLMGFFRGWVLAPLVLVFAEYCKAERFPSAYGLYMVINGVISLLLGPIVGYVRDITSSYPNCVHSLTAMTMVCILLWTVEAIVGKLRSYNKATSNGQSNTR